MLRDGLHGEERVRGIDIGVGGGKLAGDPAGVAIGQRGRLCVLALLPVEQECLHGRLGGLLAAEAGREADGEGGHDEHKHRGHLRLAGEQRLSLRRLAMAAGAGARSGPWRWLSGRPGRQARYTGHSGADWHFRRTRNSWCHGTSNPVIADRPRRGLRA